MVKNTIVRDRSFYSNINYCGDLPVTGDSGFFNTKQLTIQGGVANVGDVAHPPSVGLACKDYLMEAFPPDPFDAIYAHSVSPLRPSNAVLAAQLLAHTNPSRASVDVPAFVYEMKDIPSLIKEVGEGLLARFGDANLTWWFYWKPLLGDMRKMVLAADAIMKRQKELEHLNSSGLKRKMDLWSGSNSFSKAARYLQSYGFTAYSTNVSRTDSRIWGFVRWFPTSAPTLIKSDLREQARKAVLGLTVDPLTAWEVFPWSWFIDWFSNAGDILASHRNLVGASHSQVLIMEETTTTSRWTNTDFDSSKYCSNPTTILVNKTRNLVASEAVSAYLPILTPRQLSILGSIGVTRRMPR